MYFTILMSLLGTYYLFMTASFLLRMRLVGKVSKEERAQFSVTTLLYWTFVVALLLKVGFDFYSTQQLELEINGRSTSLNRRLSDLDGNAVVEMHDFAAGDVAEVEQHLAFWETKYFIERAVHQEMVQGIEWIVQNRASELRESSRSVTFCSVPAPIVGVAHMISHTRVLVYVDSKLGQGVRLVAKAYDQDDVPIPSGAANLTWADTFAPPSPLCKLEPGVHLLDLMCDRLQRKVTLTVRALDIPDSKAKLVWQAGYAAAQHDWAVAPEVGEEVFDKEAILELKKTRHGIGTDWYQTRVLWTPVPATENGASDE